jgi:dTDP-4-amino-4,6-dideoxygalactose transaminase
MINPEFNSSAADTRTVPFLDLRVGDAEERGQIHEAIETVMRHGRIVLGPEVGELERRVAARVGTKFAVGVGSGSDALIIALRALEIGPGDEVIVPALSFIATANAVSVVGASAVFADLDDDCNIDPVSIDALLTANTKAILPVHWTGRVADMDAILDIARAHGVPVIEDASQAFDSSRRGSIAGSMGTIGCFSMNSMKVFASLGEAGMMVMDDPDLYERCLALRYHGMVNREYCVAIGQNSRLDTLQAAVLLVRLKSLQSNIESRRNIAAYYSDRLGSVVSVPIDRPDERQVYYTYTIRCDRRDELKAFLEMRGIEVKIQHPLLMPEHPAYRSRARGSWSNAERLIKDVLCLPCSERTSASDVHYVTEAVLAFYSGSHTD